jgi:phosphatidate cytidylyltransferase
MRGDPNQGLINAAVNLFGIIYIGFMFAFFLLLRFIPGGDGFFYMLTTAFITFANDTAAYFIGVKFGRHKLSPKISPKKSVEGSLGGLLGGLIAAVVLGLFFGKSLWFMLILGVLIVIAGQFGDLIESVIKRNAGVKDSGMFLPGHGGVLDRLDSLLLSAPVVYYFVTYFRL